MLLLNDVPVLPYLFDNKFFSMAKKMDMDLAGAVIYMASRIWIRNLGLRIGGSES